MGSAACLESQGRIWRAMRSSCWRSDTQAQSMDPMVTAHQSSFMMHSGPDRLSSCDLRSTDYQMEGGCSKRYDSSQVRVIFSLSTNWADFRFILSDDFLTLIHHDYGLRQNSARTQPWKCNQQNYKHQAVSAPCVQFLWQVPPSLPNICRGTLPYFPLSPCFDRFKKSQDGT